MHMSEVICLTHVHLVYNVDTTHYIVATSMYTNRACPEVYKTSVYAPIYQITLPK